MKMKKFIAFVVILLFTVGVSYSQTDESGRDVNVKPLIVTENVNNVVPLAQDSLKISDSDDGGSTILKSAEATADQVTNDNLIVVGGLSVGIDAASGDDFNFVTLRLKENNTRIYFDDTSTGTFPSNDWILEANSIVDGGANYFAIKDAATSRNIFSTSAGAPANSLFIDNIGRVGFGTAAPVLRMHVSYGNTPGIRLDQPNTQGWGTYIWDVAGNETNFFIRDVTGGSQLPFRIQPGAPTNTLTLRQKGYVGIGTWSPETQLHVVGNIKVDSTLRYNPIDTVGIAEIEGTMIMDSTQHAMKFYNGTDWISILQYNYLTGNNLALSGSDSLVDLSKFLDNTDAQVLSLVNDSLFLTGSDSKVDLASYLDNTDNQQLNLSGDSLSIEDGNTVDLSKYYDNTDEQLLSLTNDTLALSGSGSKVSLTSYLDNTDNQLLSLSGNSLSIENGNSVDLSGFVNTDNQSISLVSNTLKISGSTSYVELSQYLDNTDDQVLYMDNNYLHISGTASKVNLGSYLDNTDNQEILLSGNLLGISGSETTADLSAFMDNTDEQTLLLTDNELSIENGNSVDLSGLMDNTDEQTLSLSGAELSISNGNTVDLSGITENTDEQTLALDGTMLSISNGNSVDLSSLVIEQQDQIEQLNSKIDTLSQEIAELKALVATIVGNKDVDAVVNKSAMEQNIPNPFSTTTVIPFNISNDVKSASLAFYSQKGQLIKTVPINERGSGSYTFIPDSSSQIFLYSLIIDGVKVETKKMIYSK